MSAIVKLEASNVKRLRAVSITPDGNTVIIGGRNGQGKTSVLDAITMALGGKGTIPSMPVREGEDKARVVLELDDLIVTRTMTPEGGGTLKVETRSGDIKKSPQAVLDALTGKLTFDPLAFSMQDPKTQRTTLQGLVGVNTDAHDAQYADSFALRTQANRQARDLEGQLAGMPFFPEAPAEEVSLADLLGEARRRADINRANQEARREAETIDSKLRQKQAAIAKMKAAVAEAELEEEALNKELSRASERAAALQDADEDEIKAKIATAEQDNRKARQNADRKKVEERLKGVIETSDELTTALKAIEAMRSELIASAKFPVEGLGFGDGQVTFNGIPLDQCSSAEQLRISVAIGLAMNPKLKVLLIRDGSLLDADSLKLVADMAREADAQVWIERVGDGEECHVVIEDGTVIRSTGQPQAVAS